VTSEFAVLEEWLLRVVTDPAPLEATLDRNVALVEGRSLETLIEGDGASRLAIYRRAYFSRLVECLAVDFPATREALGASRFDEIGRAYFVENPSKYLDLNEVGRRFPAYLATLDEIPVFALSLAELEWCIAETIHSPDASRVSREAVSSLMPTELNEASVVINPHAKFLRFDYPVRSYLAAYHAGEKPEAPEAKEEHVIVLRSGTRVFRLEVEPRAVELLNRLRGGALLGEAFANLPLDPADVSRWFREWNEKTVFLGFATK
jgi:hypothetical protein